MLEQKNYCLAAELQRLREVQESGAATETNTQETDTLRVENAKLNTTVQTLQMQQTSYQATHQEVTMKISSIEAENLSLQQQVTGLKTSQYRLQQQVNSTEQEKKMLNEQLRQLQLTARSGAKSSEVSSLQQQPQQITQERDSAKRQMQSMEHFKTLLEDENMRQKETISKLQSQVSTDKILTSEETNHTPSPSLVKKPTKRSSKAIIKQATTSTSGKKTPVWCEPVTSVSKGQRVVIGQSGGDECGTVRVVNVTIGSKTGFVGIEMDLPSMCASFIC